MKQLKLFIKTTGCQMNEYDSGRMIDALKRDYVVENVKTPEEADLALLNTCSIREKAQEKVFSLLGQWRVIKDKRPELLIGVGGCVASQEGAGIIKRAPFVDLVFGPQTLHRLPDLLKGVLDGQKSAVDISFPEIEKFDCLPAPTASGPTAFVTIMEGCSKYCSYCVVPYTRGEEISRPFDDVIADIYALAGQGVREVTLLGQNVNDYRGVMESGEMADLALLIEYMAVIDGIDRIRFTTSHPNAFSDNLIDAYARIPELANHLHLPVQSGSDRILAQMKRGYTALEFKSKIRKLRKVRPGISISSDFIIGFPGETEKDFEATMALVRDVGFDTSYTFIFSPRPGTPAANLADMIPLDEQKRRLQRIQDEIKQYATGISQKMIGTTQKVLVLGKAKKHAGQISGRTENNRVVNFMGDEALLGTFVNVAIKEALPNSLRGIIA